jgi:hypothetical protein
MPSKLRYFHAESQRGLEVIASGQVPLVITPLTRKVFEALRKQGVPDVFSLRDCSHYRDSRRVWLLLRKQSAKWQLRGQRAEARRRAQEIQANYVNSDLSLEAEASAAIPAPTTERGGRSQRRLARQRAERVARNP